MHYRSFWRFGFLGVCIVASVNFVRIVGERGYSETKNKHEEPKCGPVDNKSTINIPSVFTLGSLQVDDALSLVVVLDIVALSWLHGPAFGFVRLGVSPMRNGAIAPEPPGSWH